jgi:hypothetical protein
MLKIYTTTRIILLSTFILYSALKSIAQTTTYLTPGVPYTQDFNGLPNSGTGNILADWEIDETILDGLIDANDGLSASAGIFSFGTLSTTDRALGSITQSLVEPMLYGLLFENLNAYAITSLTIQYTGEQWRFGGSITDELVLEYRLGGSGISGGTWTAVNALKFTSPITTGTVGNLDGNSNANKTTLTSTIIVSIPQGQTIWIRWRDQYSGTNDNGLAIDDLIITPNAEISGPLSSLDVNGKVTLSGNTTISGTTTFIDGNSRIDIGSNTLTISGALSGVTPVFKGSHTSNLIIDGSSTIGTINFDQTTPGTSNLLNSLTINRSGATVTLGNALNISDNNGSVDLTSGTLVTGGNLTLLSSNSGTARIGAISSGISDLTGNITAQRYMQGNVIDYRGWRTMGAITSNFNVNQLTDDIFVTGPGGATNGFDGNGTNSSVMYYEEDFNAGGGRGWKSITSTSTSFSAGQGMLVFYRGDRTQSSSITNTTVVPNATTIDVVGEINKGNVIVNLKYNDDSNGATEDGWNFISNPYPSQINWGNVSKGVSVDNNIAILNPLTNGYVPLGLADYIPSHQGFFVKANAAGQSITFEENDKVSNGNTPYFKTQVNPFSIKMYEDSIKYDIALLKFDGTANKNYVFKEDALKMTNSRINLGYVTPNNKIVQVNSIPNSVSNSTDTFVITTTSIKNGTHWLTFEDKAILPASKSVFLVDGFNNNIIDVKTTNSYSFTINLSSV